jgi:hypothetical protein
MFMTFCEGLPVAVAPPSTTTPPAVSGKLVEKYIDDIARSISIEHENALKLVKNQQDISLGKKQKLDVLTGEFQSLSAKLSNITATYNEYKNQRNTALVDYDKFMENFKKVEVLIKKSKTDYENEMRFLNDIKAYIRRVQSVKC